MAKQFHYEVKEIAPDTFLVNEFFSTMFVLCGTKRALVIDCGTGVGDFRSVVESITSLPYDVAMTHTHVDHVGGRGQFSEIYTSETDKKFIKEVTLFQRKGFVLTNKPMNNYSGLKIEKVATEPRVKTLRENDVFDLGDRTVRVISTPGHTLGSISFLDEKNRTIYIGDVANEFLFMFLPHCTTIDEMIKTHEKLLGDDRYDTVWSSHHTEPNTKEDIKKYYEGAKRLASKKNIPLPIILIHDYKGAKLIYRPSIIHSKRRRKPSGKS